jgi:hypothetical protein
MSLLPLLSVNVHRFFVRPYVPSGAATYPNSKYNVLSSHIFDGDGTFPVYLYFSYSYRQDVQLPFFGRRHTNGQKWTYLHIYMHITDNNYCIVKDHLYHLAIFLKAN